MRAKSLAGLWVAAAVLGVPSHAHHSFGMFDQTDGEEIVVTGAVKRWQFVNPHTWLIITVTNDDGIPNASALERWPFGQ